MRRILQPFRFLTVFVMIFMFLGQVALTWVFVRDYWKRIYIANQSMHFWIYWGTKVLGFKLNFIGEARPFGDRGGLYVGNHTGYMDILVFSSLLPASFITSKEIKNTPLLGQICQMAGCLFVERRNKENISNEIGEIRDGLRHGLTVAIFPEATSTNGEALFRFRKPLFQAAIDAPHHLIPFVINYRTVGGKPLDITNRDTIFWYGDMSFAPHLWKLCGAGGATVDIHFLTPISAEGKTSEELAAESQIVIEKVFIPVYNPANPNPSRGERKQAQIPKTSSEAPKA